MPVNALIPMGFQPTQGVGPDIGAALQNARQGWDIEARRQTLGQINALKDIFNQPGALDKDGQPTRETLQKVWAASPDMGLSLQQNMLNQQYRALQARVMQSKFADEKHQLQINAQGAAWNAYKDTLERTHNEAEAQKAGQDTLTREMQPGLEGGMYSPQEIAAVPPFTPGYAHAVSQTPTQQEAEDLRKQQIDFAMQKFAEQQRLAAMGKPESWMLKGATEPVSLVYNRDQSRYETLAGEPVDTTGGHKIIAADVIPAGELYSPEDVKSLVTRYLAGDPNVMQEMRLGGFGGRARAQNAKAFEDELNKQMEGKPPSEVMMAQARFHALTKELGTLAQQEGTLARTYTELTQGGPSGGGFAKQVLDTSNAVPRTGWKALNKLGEGIQLQGGGQNIVKFMDALQGFQNAYASIFSRAGGPTSVYAMEHADKVLQESFSKGQIKAGIEQLMTEVEIAKEAPGIAMEDAIKISQSRQSERATTLPRVSTQSQYDALKSGDSYIGEDGAEYRKP